MLQLLRAYTVTIEDWTGDPEERDHGLGEVRWALGQELYPACAVPRQDMHARRADGEAGFLALELQ